MLSSTQRARVKWLKGLGLRIGQDFEVEETGVFLYVLDDHVPWQNLASQENRDLITEMVRDNGAGKPFEYDAETLSALNEDHILSMVNDHIGSAGEDSEILNEVLCAQLEAQVGQVLDAIEGEDAEAKVAVTEALERVAVQVEAEIAAEVDKVIMEPAAEREEMAFVITASGVALSRAFRQAIAARAKELFEQPIWKREADLGRDIPTAIQGECLSAWGEITRTRQRGAYAAYRYAVAVVRNLTRQAQGGLEFRVNSYWG